jgi:4-methyl-5(b-hydroxyethyl)-thiazole monophosphate biosynthesis
MSEGKVDSPKVLVPLANGSEDIESIVLIDVLRRAQAVVTVVSIEDSELTITGEYKIKITADALLKDVTSQTFDLIVLPGGPGAEKLAQNAVLVDLLKSQRDSGRWYGGVCEAPVAVFQAHGLLDGKKAACHPDLASKLDRDSYLDQTVVVSGNCSKCFFCALG